MKIDKSMEQLNSVFREKMTMSIDDIAIHVYILSIWVQWYYRVCLHPVTAYVRVNMVTAWLPVVSLSNDQCQNVSICYCVCLPIVIRFLFLIYIIKTLLLLLSEPLCLLHTRTPIVKASFLFYIPAPLSKLHCLPLFTVKCHFVTYIASVTASCIPAYTVITWLSTVCCRRYFIVHSTHPWTNPYCLLRIKFLC